MNHAAASFERAREAAKVIDKARANERKLAYTFADQLGQHVEVVDELVEGLLVAGGMSVFYGDSNVGKSFVAIDLAAAVCRHVHWMGRHVEQALVIYLAAESPASVRIRLYAYQQHHGVKVPNFVIVEEPVNLYGGDTDTQAVIDLVLSLMAQAGAKRVLIVGDTLARMVVGANENSGEDMGPVVQRCDRIRKETGAHLMLVHHSGKDAARGARGWSGLRAATDTELEVTSDEANGLRAVEVTKQRDLGGKCSRIGFRLEVVTLGVGKWGQPITSCVVAPSDAPVKAAKGKRPSEIAGAVAVLLGQRGTGMKRTALYDALSSAPYTWSRNSVKNEVSRMVRDGRLNESVGVVALAAPMPATPGAA